MSKKGTKHAQDSYRTAKNFSPSVDGPVYFRRIPITQKSISLEAYHHPDGRTTNELAKDRLNRTTISTHVKELIKNHLVTKKGDNKFARYQLTQIVLRTQSCGGLSLSGEHMIGLSNDDCHTLGK